MSYDLSGQVALVTGGGRDIGRAISLRLAECGCSVVVNYHTSEAEAQATVQAIEQQGGRGTAVQADVTQAEDVERLLDATRAAFGETLHVLVNNAGGLVARKTLDEMDEAFWRQVIDLNLTSAFLVTKAALPYLADGASIVNLTSLAARNGGGRGASAYATAKGGLLTFTRSLAKELGPLRRIRANAVSAGLIATTFHDRFTPPDVRTSVVEGTPLGREGQAEDVADVVAYLASGAAAFITGESIEINGGVYFK